MSKNTANLSVDKLIAQATCAVIINGKVQGTAWLVSTEGHLLTAGHLLGTSKPLERVTVQFSEDIPHEAYKIQWGYQQDMGIDFAVIQLVEPVADRMPLPVSLSREIEGSLRLYGYGKTFQDISSGQGNFLGFFDPHNSPGNRLFQLRSPELGEGGYSGAAIFSDALQAVVALQIEATKAEVGAGRDTVLAMPLYRIAHHWEQLFQLEKKSKPKQLQADIFNIRTQAAVLPLSPLLYHFQSPEMHWSNRVSEISLLTELWQNEQTRVVGLIGLGGVGKSSLVRRWYDQSLKTDTKLDGFFWWSFYCQPSFDEFLEIILSYLTNGQFDPTQVLSPWAKVQQLISLLCVGKFVIVLDGLETMQQTVDAGDDFGRLSDRAFRKFLELCGDPNSHQSFIIATSRFPITDLKLLDGFSYRSMLIENLTGQDAAEYLKRRGINGSIEDLQKVANEYGGHALSLSLLAGYIDEYFDGDSSKSNEIPFLAMDEATPINRILQAYGNRLTEHQSAFMKILVSFRRPVTHNMLEQFLRNDEFISSNSLLRSLSVLKSFELRGMISNLGKRSLIYREKNYLDEWTYTTHMIVREYFYSELGKDPELALKVNLQLRDYSLSIPRDKDPKRIEELMPLFDVVFYTCRAKLFDEAAQIYQDNMIERFGNWGISFKFGVYELQLSFLRDFFPNRDLSKLPKVNFSRLKIFLLIEVAWCLDRLGQSVEARDCYQRATRIELDPQDNNILIPVHYYLGYIQSLLGELGNASISLKRAIDLSVSANDHYWQCNSWALLGWLQFLQGDIDKSESSYEESYRILRLTPSDQKSKFISYQVGEEDLFFILGVQYATTLLLTGDVAMSFQKAQLNLKVCRQLNWSEGVAYCCRMLGDIELVKANISNASDYYSEALDISRKFGTQIEVWRVLLGMSKIAIANQKFEEAIANLISALEISKKFKYQLAAIDIYNFWSELCIVQGELDSAEELSQQALEIANLTHYEWGRSHSLHNLGHIAYLSGNLDLARKRLTEAYEVRKHIRDVKIRSTEEMLIQANSE